MKNYLLIVLAALCFTSCDSISGKGNLIKDQREVTDFKSLKSSGSIDVEIIMGDRFEVVVEDYENLVEYIVTEVRNGTLNVHFENNISIMNSEATVYVTVPTLNKITGSGSADISVSGILKHSENIELAVSGSGSIEATVDAPSVKATISGSGEMDLAGNTKEFECRISGSGDLEAEKLLSEKCKVTVSGSGTAKVFASVSLDANIRGSGDVVYGGNPSSPQVNISGSGTVRAEK